MSEETPIRWFDIYSAERLRIVKLIADKPFRFLFHADEIRRPGMHDLTIRQMTATEIKEVAEQKSKREFWPLELTSGRTVTFEWTLEELESKEKDERILKAALEIENRLYPLGPVNQFAS